MTNDQIAELERWWETGQASGGVGPDVLTERLLEEREALLSALKPFAEMGGAATFTVMMQNYGMPIKILRRRSRGRPES